MQSNSGRVYDVDFVQSNGWCQILLDGNPGELIAKTADERLQSLLLIALATRSTKTSIYYDNTPDGNFVRGVRLIGESQPGKVALIEVGIDSDLFQVEIDRKKLLVHDPRLQIIVAQSLEQTDATFEYSAAGNVLIRAKLNRG
jgi:hypothetical protein